MKSQLIKSKRLSRRKRRIRKRVFGTAERPRLTVTRSVQHIYAQVIDDDRGHTLVSASSRDKQLGSSLANGGNRAAAEAVGKLVAERAKSAGINEVSFDRNGRLFHGRVQALADAAREAGLKF